MPPHHAQCLVFGIQWVHTGITIDPPLPGTMCWTLHVAKVALHSLESQHVS